MRTAAIVAALVIIFTSPIADQCDQPVFAKANPGLCNYQGPFGQFPGGGGGGDGGLIGGIGRVLHGLTGGLL
jgi:hypothetical protein